MNIYDIGARARLRAVFTNSAGTQVDPSTVTLQTRWQQSAPSSYDTLVYGVNSIVRSAAGDFYHDFPCNSGGQWYYRWAGTGDNPAAAEGSFQIRPGNFG